MKHALTRLLGSSPVDTEPGELRGENHTQQQGIWGARVNNHDQVAQHHGNIPLDHSHGGLGGSIAKQILESAMLIGLLSGSTLVGGRQSLQAGLRERRHTDKKEEDSKKDNKKRAKARKARKAVEI
jgi:hypothetical protein